MASSSLDEELDALEVRVSRGAALVGHEVQRKALLHAVLCGVDDEVPCGGANAARSLAPLLEASRRWSRCPCVP